MCLLALHVASTYHTYLQIAVRPVNLEPRSLPTCLPSCFFIDFVLRKTLIFAIPYSVFEGFSTFQQIASKVLFRPQNSSKTSPKSLQNASKSLPRGPQDTPRTLPRGPKGVPRALQTLPRALKMTKISHSEPLRVPTRLPRESQRPPKRPKSLPRALQQPPKTTKSPSRGPPDWFQQTSQASILSVSNTI